MFCCRCKNSRVELFTDRFQKAADRDRLFGKSAVDVLNKLFQILERIIRQVDIVDPVDFIVSEFDIIALGFTVVVVAADRLDNVMGEVCAR